VPQFAVKSNTQYWETIQKQYQAISGDLQGLNRHRYRQITGGNQEFMEALSFQHYLETQTLISYEASQARVASMSGEGGAVQLAPEDYVLGIFDMVGELMRFSITSMATNGKLPAGKPNLNKKLKRDESEGEAGDKMEIDEEIPAPADAPAPRNVLSDLRELRLQLEMFDPPRGEKFYFDVEKKMTVMRECVDKVEKALYSLTVRGKERPKGWQPGASEDRRATVESY
jgi:predicted translin family RNA/ssDNA-binding protein